MSDEEIESYILQTSKGQLISLQLEIDLNELDCLVQQIKVILDLID